MYCSKWLHALSVLGFEFLRPSMLFDMSKLEAAEFAAEEKKLLKLVKLLLDDSVVKNRLSKVDTITKLNSNYLSIPPKLVQRSQNKWCVDHHRDNNDN